MVSGWLQSLPLPSAVQFDAIVSRDTCLTVGFTALLAASPGSIYIVYCTGNFPSLWNGRPKSKATLGKYRRDSFRKILNNELGRYPLYPSYSDVVTGLPRASAVGHSFLKLFYWVNYSWDLHRSVWRRWWFKVVFMSLVHLDHLGFCVCMCTEFQIGIWNKLIDIVEKRQMNVFCHGNVRIHLQFM